MAPWTLDDLNARLVELTGGVAPDPDRERTRLRILSVATEHFERFGYRKASIADIAADAGVGKGTVYLYVASKKRLLLACVAQERLALVPELRRVHTLEGAERLEAYLFALLRFSLTAPLNAAILRGERELELLLSEIGDAQLTRDTAHSVDLLASLLPVGREGLSDARRHELAAALTTLLGLAAHAVDGRMRAGLSGEDFARTSARLLTAGVMAELG